MLNFDVLCLELFGLAQQEMAGNSAAARGTQWEERVAGHFARRGIPVESVPGSTRVLAFSSCSGLSHQVDATLHCRNAIVLAEWKAYQGTFRKNDLLRFKAATDDFYMSFGHSGLSRPIFRVFGGVGRASNGLRSYAAQHGIALLERDRWPLTVLASDSILWPGEPQLGPSIDERRALSWGVRPLQHVIRPQSSGEFLLSRPRSRAQIESLLQLQDFWSDLLWTEWDAAVGEQETMLPVLLGRREAA